MEGLDTLGSVLKMTRVKGSRITYPSPVVLVYQGKHWSKGILRYGMTQCTKYRLARAMVQRHHDLVSLSLDNVTPTSDELP